MARTWARWKSRPGNYQIRVTLAGNPAAVVYDAGTVALADGADLLLVAVANTTTGPAPITLLVNDGTTQAELLDVATTADVRAGHLSPDAPAVDVIVNDDLANPLFNAATYPVADALRERAAGHLQHQGRG